LAAGPEPALLILPVNVPVHPFIARTRARSSFRY
jgi:hypothetical protein